MSLIASTLSKRKLRVSWLMGRTLTKRPSMSSALGDTLIPKAHHGRGALERVRGAEKPSIRLVSLASQRQESRVEVLDMLPSLDEEELDDL
jgi:hypothetical protein